MGDITHFHNKCHHRHIHRRTPHAIYYRGHNPCIFRWFGCRVLPRHQSHAFGSCFRYPSALGVEWLSRGKSVREDSAIAVVWALGMAIGIIFIFMTPGYTPGLTEFLFGNILTITRTDIFIFAAFAALLILYTVLQYKTIVYTAFDADFAHTRGIKTRLVNYIMTFFVATAVVLTIRLVGIMLLISILSLPQMIAELFCHKFRNIVWLSGAINLLCGIGGLLLSYWLDVPAGATIVFTLIIAYFVVKIIASYLHSATGKKQ